MAIRNRLIDSLKYFGSCSLLLEKISKRQLIWVPTDKTNCIVAGSLIKRRNCSTVGEGDSKRRQKLSNNYQLWMLIDTTDKYARPVCDRLPGDV